MAAPSERRRVRRIPVGDRPGGRVRATLEARLLDLSAAGARIQHENLLRPGFACSFEFPPTLAELSLPVQVVRSTVVGAGAGQAGERTLRYESGLTFVGLTVSQREILASVIERLAPSESLGEGWLVIPDA